MAFFFADRFANTPGRSATRVEGTHFSGLNKSVSLSLNQSLSLSRSFSRPLSLTLFLYPALFLAHSLSLSLSPSLSLSTLRSIFLSPSLSAGRTWSSDARPNPAAWFTVEGLGFGVEGFGV